MTSSARPFQETVSATFTRPADTTPYAAADLAANSTTAGSVNAMTFAFNTAGWLRKVTLTHSQASATNSSFKLWLLTASITPTNGDNGALGNVTLANVLAVIPVDVDDVDATDGAFGVSTYDHGLIELPATCYGYLQADAAYTPASGETFVAALTIDAV